MGFNLKKAAALYRRSFNLNTENDREYLELVSDLLDTNEVQYLKNNIQHSDINALDHVRSVSYIAYTVCKHSGLNYKAAARAGLLHDLVYYDWHDDDPSHRLHGYRHPGFALKNARELTTLSPLEENIIIRHMWPLTPTPPRYKEAWVVTLVDKYCATRETLRKYQRNPEVLRDE